MPARRSRLGRERRLTAQDLELRESSSARNAPSSSPRSRRARTRSRSIDGRAGGIAAPARDQRARGEHFVGDRDRVEIARDRVGGVERGGGFDEPAFAREPTARRASTIAVSSLASRHAGTLLHAPWARPSAARIAATRPTYSSSRAAAR